MNIDDIDYFAYHGLRLKDKSLKSISERYGREWASSFKTFLRHNASVVHSFVLKTLVHSLKKQAELQGGACCSFEYDVSSDSYSAALIVMKVPQQLVIDYIDDPIYNRDTKMFFNDTRSTKTMNDYIISLKGRFVVFDIFSVKYKDLNDLTIYSDALDEGYRNLTMPSSMSKYGKRSQDVAYHILSSFKRKGVIEEFSIIEKESRDGWGLHECIVDMGDSNIKIVIGTDNGTPEQTACQKIVDACTSISRMPCACHVLNKLMSKTVGFEVFENEGLCYGVLENTNLLSRLDTEINVDIFNNITSNAYFKKLRKKLESRTLFTNRSPTRSPAVRLSSVVDLEKTNMIFTGSVNTIEDIDNETIESVYNHDHSGFSDEALLFIFAYVSYYETQCIEFLEGKNKPNYLMNIDIYLNNKTNFESRGGSQRERPTVQQEIPFYNEFTRHLDLMPLYEYSDFINEQKKCVQKFASIQSVIAVEIMSVFFKYHSLWCTYTGKSCVLKQVRWSSLETIYEVLCSGLYVDIPLTDMPGLRIAMNSDNVVVNMSHLEITEAFLNSEYHKYFKDIKLPIKRILKSTNNQYDASTHYRHFLGPFYEALNNENNQPHAFSLGTDMWSLSKAYLTVLRQLMHIQKLCSDNSTSALHAYHQIAMLLFRLLRYISEAIYTENELKIAYFKGLFEYNRHYLCKFFVMPEPLVAYLLCGHEHVKMKDIVYPEEQSRKPPKKGTLSEELRDLCQDFSYISELLPNIMKEDVFVRLKGVMIYSFLQTKFKPYCVNDHSLALVANRVPRERELSYQFMHPKYYKGLVAHIISLLCTNFSADFSSCNEERQNLRDVLNDNPVTRPPVRSLNEVIEFEILSPVEREDYPPPFVREPPVSAARSSSYEFNFDDQSLRERDIRSALIYGCQHEDVVGLSVIQEIVNKYKTVPASNACVERGFSVLKTAHTCKQKLLSTQLRFDWFLYHEADAVAALTIEDIEKAMNIEREAE
ncbi:hypothetical protein PCE1_003503 [Barthelona sp. PCE]